MPAVISRLCFKCLKYKYNSKGRSIPTCSTHCLELYWQMGTFDDTSPLQDMPGNNWAKLTFLSALAAKSMGGAGWSLVFPAGEATIPLGSTLRSCETSQPPLESNSEVFAGGLKSGLSLTGDCHSS